MVRLYTFGGLRIERDKELLRLPTQKACDLLAYLITFRDRPHPRSALVNVLWPEYSEEKARQRLSDALWRVRHAIGDIILADEFFLQFNLNYPHWLDVEQFETLIARHPQSADFSDLNRALALYRGPYLDGIYDDWALLERERLRELYLETLEGVLEGYKQVGDYSVALKTAQQLVAVEPLHEAAHRELIRLYHLLKRDAEAIAQYHRCQQILWEELHVAPAPETEALYHALSNRTLSQSAAPVAHLPIAAHRALPELDALPLVGRDTERTALLNHLEGAAAGRGNVILLEGEAGIGKSRLAQEIINGARWRNICAAQASASDTMLSASYTLLLNALTPLLTPLRCQQLIHVVETSDLQALTPLIPRLAPALPEGASLPALSPPQAHRRLQNALIALILGLARITPHLWVLEDLQWADAETLSLLPLLRPYLAHSRTLVLITGRNAELRSNLVAWEALQELDRAGAFPRQRLNRLDEDTIAHLTRLLLGEEEPNTPALSRRLMQESAGVPLYLVETLKTWRDQGHLVHGERGTWRWCGDASGTSAPYLGTSVIDHRLSQLSPDAEDVLSAAAVIGAEVDFDLLSHVCELSSSDHYLLATDELLHLGFLVETDVGYCFSHERIRQAINGRLSPSQRQHLHRRAAHAAESLFPDQFERLAYHFIAAGERSPAIHYLTRAAGQARELFAHQTALSCYDRLLEFLNHPDDTPARCDILRDRAEVLGWIGDREAQGRDLEELLRLARALSDDIRLAEALHRRSEWQRIQGQYKAANEDALAALEIYRRLGDERAQAASLAQLGWNIVYTANRAQAVDYFRQALPIYEALGDLAGQINCLSGLVNIAELDGDYGCAWSYLQRNLALAEATGDPIRISRAYHNRGVLQYDGGNLSAAETDLEQALALKKTTGDRRSEAITHFYLGVVNTECGDLETAQTHLNAALETFRDVQDLSWEGDALAALGQLALIQNDVAAAAECLEISHQRRRELGEPTYAVIDLSYLAVAELFQGESERAWRHSLEAVAELETGLSGIEHPQRIYHNHFRVAERTHHWAAARDALEKAIQILDERAKLIDDPAWQEKYRTGLRVNQAITQAAAHLPPPGRLRVRLARDDVPTYRRPAPDEMVAVIWTVDTGEEDAALAKRDGKIALRRHRILRLLAEAESAAALPTMADLAGALQVSARTIRSDLAVVSKQGHTIRTRGSRA
ncbi:MAG: AAA family ATPase [Anaerolineae bacterium]|nr:AAA family ATPase [Anaerolineae bacterium]